MDRYDDNTSPQPSLMLENSFKTPEISSTVLIPSTTSLFPTPPSDNENNESRESISSYHKYQMDYLKLNQTPALDGI